MSKKMSKQSMVNRQQSEIEKNARELGKFSNNVK